MATHITEQYTSIDGVMTKISTESIEVDDAQLIADKEAELLAMYQELEALKAAQNA